MILRFLSIVFAITCVVFAVERVVRHRKFNSTSETLQDNKSSETRQSPVKIRWRDRSHAMVLRSDFPELQNLSASGELFVLKQRTDSREECVFGVFRMTRSTQKYLIFESLDTIPKSRLPTWAASMSASVDWRWEQFTQHQQPQDFFQYCRDWIRSNQKEDIIQQIVRGEKVFIRGSRYSEILIESPKDGKIEVDYIRRGWWVYPRTQQRKVQIHVRSASTGILESRLLVFQMTRRSKKTHTSKSTQIQTNRSFTLPGWD